MEDDRYERAREAVESLTALGDDLANDVDTALEPFFVTKEHRRFIEFADACRRHRYIGLCHGPPGVGKTQSARRYASWDELEPRLLRWRRNFTAGRERTEWHTVFYTPALTATPRTVDRDLNELGSALAVVRADDPADRRTYNPRHGSPPFVELLIVDEADRLKTAALEQLRDHFNRSRLGLVLIGMPGIEKRLSRYPQLYSRVGFVHHYRPLAPEEQAHVLARHWPHLGLDDREDFTVAEAVAAIARITGGNFRLTGRLVAQIERILEINELRTVTKEVVETARESLVIGTL
jgi:DNA transposition AAA+ family ATPase